MIRVVRPTSPPAILQTRGQAERKKLCQQYDAAPDDYRSGEKKFSFKSAIYGHPTVKNRLCQSQHGKCAFCESKVKAVAHGDVEHFRPKAGCQQHATDELGKPGYYWLAYEWSNLLFSCQMCNQQGKKNLFPLDNPADRATCHHDDLAKEAPLLIDPTHLDPESLIGFREEVAFPRNGNSVGKATIEILGLNRETLREERRDRLNLLGILKVQAERLRADIASLGTNGSQDRIARLAEIEAVLTAAQADEAEYAAMVRCALA